MERKLYKYFIWKRGNVAIGLFVDVTALGVVAPFPPYFTPLGDLLSSWKQSSLNSSHSLCSLSPCHRGPPSLHIVPAFSPGSGKGMVGVYKEKGWKESVPQVPGRGRALWLPTAIAFILIFLTRQEKTGSSRKPYFNTKNVFRLRYLTSFAVRIPRFC